MSRIGDDLEQALVRNRPVVFVTGLAIALLSSACLAQSGSISAPNSSVAVTSVIGTTSTSFTPQTWSVASTSSSGALVSFDASGPFVSAENSGEFHDVTLQLASPNNSGPSPWYLVQALDTTNFSSGDTTARVTAACDGLGIASIDLTVTFLNPPGSITSAGAHALTITGTIGPN